MSTQIVTITHSNDGIRVAFPGATRVFSNAVLLAESYAISEQNRNLIHELLTKDAAKILNNLQSRMKADEENEYVAEVVDEIRSLLIDAGKLAS